MEKKVGLGWNLLEIMAGCTLMSERFYIPFPITINGLSLDEILGNIEPLPAVGFNTLMGLCYLAHGSLVALAKIQYANSLFPQEHEKIGKKEDVLSALILSSTVVAAAITLSSQQEASLEERTSIVINQYQTPTEEERRSLQPSSIERLSQGTMNQVLNHIVLAGAHCHVSNESYGGLGQGIVLTEEGHVLIPYHVISSDEETFCDHTERYIITQQGRVHEVTSILAVDRVHDLALVKSSYQPEHFVPPRFASSSRLRREQPYTILGLWWEPNPQIDCQREGEVRDWDDVNLRNIYSTGTFKGQVPLVSGEGYRTSDRLYFSTYTQPGFSGSAIVDEHGNIYGITTNGSGGRTLAASSDEIMNLVNSIINPSQ